LHAGEQQAWPRVLPASSDGTVVLPLREERASARQARPAGEQTRRSNSPMRAASPSAGSIAGADGEAVGGEGLRTDQPPHAAPAPAQVPDFSQFGPFVQAVMRAGGTGARAAASGLSGGAGGRGGSKPPLHSNAGPLQASHGSPAAGVHATSAAEPRSSLPASFGVGASPLRPLPSPDLRRGVNDEAAADQRQDRVGCSSGAAHRASHPEGRRRSRRKSPSPSQSPPRPSSRSASRSHRRSLRSGASRRRARGRRELSASSPSTSPSASPSTSSSSSSSSSSSTPSSEHSPPSPSARPSHRYRHRSRDSTASASASRSPSASESPRSLSSLSDATPPPHVSARAHRSREQQAQPPQRRGSGRGDRSSSERHKLRAADPRSRSREMGRESERGRADSHEHRYGGRHATTAAKGSSPRYARSQRRPGGYAPSPSPSTSPSSRDARSSSATSAASTLRSVSDISASVIVEHLAARLAALRERCGGDSALLSVREQAEQAACAQQLEAQSRAAARRQATVAREQAAARLQRQAAEIGAAVIGAQARAERRVGHRRREGAQRDIGRDRRSERTSQPQPEDSRAARSDYSSRRPASRDAGNARRQGRDSGGRVERHLHGIRRRDPSVDSRTEEALPEPGDRRHMTEKVPPAAARSLSPAGAEVRVSPTLPASASSVPVLAAELASATMRTVHTDAVLAAAAGAGAGAATGGGSQRFSSPVRFSGSRLRSPPQSPLSPMFRHVSQALQAHAALTRNTAHASVFDSLTLDSLRRSGFPAAAAAAGSSSAASAAGSSSAALRQPPASVASSVNHRHDQVLRASGSGWSAGSQAAASQASRVGELPAGAAHMQPTAADSARAREDASAAAPPATDRSSVPRTAGGAASTGYPSQAAAVAANATASIAAPPNLEHVVTGSSRRWQVAAECAATVPSSTAPLASAFGSGDEALSRHGSGPQPSAAGGLGTASHGFQPPRGGFVSASTLAEKEAQVARLLSRLTAAGALAAHA
jgi:peptidyl-prolyl isomerase G (cyclophilin G)